LIYQIVINSIGMQMYKKNLKPHVIQAD